MGTYYLVETIEGLGTFNVFQGTKEECEKEKASMPNPENYFISINRFE